MESAKKINLRCDDALKDESHIRLKRRFENHLEEWHNHKIEHAHAQEQLIKYQEITSKNIDTLYQSTKEIVSLWNALNTIQKAAIWASGFSGLVVFFGWLAGVIKIGS